MPLSEALTSHLNLWLECDGEVLFSVSHVQLLAAIDQTGWISAAAERMQVQYRLAWDRLDEMERGLGLRLVDRHTGGAGGGGARLTAAAAPRSGGSLQHAGGGGGRLSGGTLPAIFQ